VLVVGNTGAQAMEALAAATPRHLVVDLTRGTARRRADQRAAAARSTAATSAAPAALAVEVPPVPLSPPAPLAVGAAPEARAGVLP
jgi:hypothetical protein